MQTVTHFVLDADLSINTNSISTSVTSSSTAGALTHQVLTPQSFDVLLDVVDASHHLTVEFDACLSSTVRPNTAVVVSMRSEYSSTPASSGVAGRQYQCESQYDCASTSATVTTAVCDLFEIMFIV